MDPGADLGIMQMLKFIALTGLELRTLINRIRYDVVTSLALMRQHLCCVILLLAALWVVGHDVALG